MSPSSSSRAAPTRSDLPAFITGASSGIGAEFAHKLAARGHGLVLVGRREDKLNAVAADLRRQFGVDAEVMLADLSDPNALDRLERVVSERGPFAFLINNAGFGTAGPFAEADMEKQIAMIRVHVEATVRLTHAALPAMKAVGAGAIINVSSVAGFIVVPGSALYSATKAFLNSFSESVALEVRRHGVKVQALCPGYTVTEFHDREEFKNWRRENVPKLLWMTASDVVDISLDKLSTRESVVVAGMRYKLILILARSKLLFRLVRPLVRKRGRMGD